MDILLQKKRQTIINKQGSFFLYETIFIIHIKTKIGLPLEAFILCVQLTSVLLIS